MFNKFNKDIIVNKSIYSLTDRIKIEAYIQRIDKTNYDYKILETNKSYKIVVARKLESV